MDTASLQLVVNSRGQAQLGPATPADRETLMSWPQGGLPQVAQALLTEAISTEALCSALMALSAGQELEPEVFAQRVAHLLKQQVDQMTPQVTTSILRFVRANGNPIESSQ